MRIPLILASLLSLALAGCSNVGQQLLVERDAFNATLTAVHVAHIAGKVSSADEAKMLPYVQAIQAALDAGDAAYKAGNKTAAQTYLNAVVAGLAKLAEVYPAPAAATTQPVKTSARAMPRGRVQSASYVRHGRPTVHESVTEPEYPTPNALIFAPLLMAV